ncbi:hypothetical protein R5W23_001449 [Gemmata sp. JC673]|uniref:Uncharacterized protein n=1 Tax=Gemmata algarum TaxID=2975278 RepID=A0ABU5EY22_9BACT|nr:hypothetical protein [Gemmata algarum]MDY3560223.1 hypothetical protein [Gemmata algarum]
MLTEHSPATRRTARSTFARYVSDTSAATSERSYAARCCSSGAVERRAVSRALRSSVPALICSTSRSHLASTCRAACSSLQPVGRVTSAPAWSRYFAKYVRPSISTRTGPAPGAASGAVRSFPRTRQRATRWPLFSTTSAPAGSGFV